MNNRDEEAAMYEKVHTFLNSASLIETESWELFRKHSRIKKLNKQEYFLKQGEICRCLGIIIQGYVRHYYLINDTEVTNDFNFETMITGAYHSFMTQTPSRFNVIAMENTVLITFERQLLIDLYERFASWQKLGRILIENMFNRKLLREESFLLDSPEIRYQTILSKRPEMLQRIPLKHLASYMGITKETLSRIRARIK